MSTQREGWLAGDYVRIYASNDRKDVAELYGFNEFLPGYELWGSWGCDALCLAHDSKLYRIPWIPLSQTHRQEAYVSVEALDSALVNLHEALPAYEHYNREIHFVTPIVFGGSPADDANIAMVDRVAHAQICRYWNGVYSRLQSTRA